MTDKVTATPEALGLLAEIIADHGPLLFPPIGRLLRRLIADVLPAGRVPDRPKVT